MIVFSGKHGLPRNCVVYWYSIKKKLVENMDYLGTVLYSIKKQLVENMDYLGTVFYWYSIKKKLVENMDYLGTVLFIGTRFSVCI